MITVRQVFWVAGMLLALGWVDRSFAAEIFLRDEMWARDLAYSGKRDIEEELYLKMEQIEYASEDHRAILLVQAYSMSTNPDLLAKGIAIATEYVESARPGWGRDFVTMQLAVLLGLNGQRAEGNRLAELLIQEDRTKSIVESDDAFLDFLRNRLGLDKSEFERYLQDSLRRQIGFYYLNRKEKEGGSDPKRAKEWFSSIRSLGARSECLNDARIAEILDDGDPAGGKANPLVYPDGVTPSVQDQSQEDSNARDSTGSEKDRHYPSALIGVGGALSIVGVCLVLCVVSFIVGKRFGRKVSGALRPE